MRERRYSSTKSDELIDYVARDLTIGLVEKEARGASQKHPVMYGHAARFNTWSQNLGGFIETIVPGFFRKAISPEQLEAFSLFNHNDDRVLGATENNELTVKEDEVGLYHENVLIGDTTDSNNMIAHLRAKRIYKMSFGFSTHPDGDEWQVDGTTNKRILLPDGCSKLWDTSPVTFPAYRATDVGIRSLSRDDKDVDRIMVALVRCEKNLPATKEDMENLKDFRSRVDTYLAHTSGVSKEAVLDIKRRMLLLMA